MCLNIGTHKNINFSFETNGKLMALGVPILRHFRVVLILGIVMLKANKTCKNILSEKKNVFFFCAINYC